MNNAGDESRLPWIDLARGAAVILVIVSHAAVLGERQGLLIPEWVTRINSFFLPYRMPTLMFLSGLLLASSLRKTAYQYYEGKIRHLVWPYFVWASILLIIVGTEYPLYSLRAWFPLWHLWFLAFVAAYYFIAPFLKPIPVWIVPLVMMGASVPFDPIDDGILKKFFYYGSFFFLGHAASAYGARFQHLLSSRWIPLILVTSFAFGVYATMVSVEHEWRYAPLNVLGIVAAVWLAKRVEKHRLMRPVKYLGRYSIVFYVSHVPITMVLLSWTTTGNLEAALFLIPLTITVSLAAGYLLSCFGTTAVGRWLFSTPSLSQGFVGKSASMRKQSKTLE